MNEPRDHSWADSPAPQFASAAEAFLQSVEDDFSQLEEPPVSEGSAGPLVEPIFASAAEELWLDVQAD